jgi:CheY-like chemotaxis protein
MNSPKSDQRKVLLIDHNSRRQQLRAVALRNCEIEVQTAFNVTDAVRLAQAHFFDLVLLAAEEDSFEALLLCAELKKGKSRRIALLVGAPHYLRELAGERKKADPSSKHPAPRLVVRTTQPQPNALERDDGTLARCRMRVASASLASARLCSACVVTQHCERYSPQAPL